VGRRKTLGGDKLSPAFGTNLVFRHSRSDWVQFSLGVYNLFNEDIRIPSGNQQFSNGTDYLRLRGRSYRVQVGGRF
jgi:hypothetical protein